MTRAPGAKFKWYGPWESQRTQERVSVGVRSLELSEIVKGRCFTVVEVRVQPHAGPRYQFRIHLHPLLPVKTADTARLGLAYFDAHPELKGVQRSNGRKLYAGGGKAA